MIGDDVAERSRRRSSERVFGERGRAVGCLLAGAIVLAPFLALLYGPVAGLAIMVLALAATAFLTGEVGRTADGPTRRRLLVAAVVNALLALGGMVALAAVLS